MNFTFSVVVLGDLVSQLESLVDARRSSAGNGRSEHSYNGKHPSDEATRSEKMIKIKMIFKE